MTKLTNDLVNSLREAKISPRVVEERQDREDKVWPIIGPRVRAEYTIYVTGV